jgi:hypothetical protein
MQPRLIFLAGYPRSGTTWLSNLLNAHPAVIYRHEYLGRCWGRLPEPLFTALKTAHGLDDNGHQHLIEKIAEAHYEADRPPFFRKVHLRINNPQLKHRAWLATRFSQGALSPLYRRLFQPRLDGQTIVMKETRASTNMLSMIRGLRPNNCLFLFRHPCGSIASQLRGIASGRMQAPSRIQLQTFIRENQQTLESLGLPDSDFTIAEQSVESQLAIMWSVQNADYLEFSTQNHSILVNYEAFLMDSQTHTARLFKHLGLSENQQVLDFLAASGGGDAAHRDAGSEFYSVYRSGNFRSDGWRETLSARQISAIESIAAPTYQRLLACTEGEQ